MNARWLVVETQTKQGRSWHVRFQADNAEAVVHGQNLTSKDSAYTAILSVARAHAVDGWAHIDENRRVVVGGGTGPRARIPIVHLTEPVAPPRPKSMLGDLAESVRVMRRRRG